MVTFQWWIQIRGWWGGGGGGGGGGKEGSYRDPEIRWEPDLKEIYFGLSSLILV